MSEINKELQQISVEHQVPAPKDFAQIACDLCEQALNDAKEQLHPLLRNVQLDRLNERPKFVQGFKRALEQRIAKELVAWQSDVQAVFQFDETRTENWETWNGSIHLLVKVPCLSDALKTLGRMLDQNLVKYLRQLGWSRFKNCCSILEIQEVTPNEIRHGTCYGAMFYAEYTVPAKVWPKS